MSDPTLSVSKSFGLAPLFGGLARSAVLTQLRNLRQGRLRLICQGPAVAVRRCRQRTACRGRDLRRGSLGHGGGQRLDRCRRSLYPRLLAQSGPGRGHPPVRRQPGGARRPRRRPGAPGSSDPAPAARVQSQQPARLATQHPGPLRSGQCLVRAAAGPDHDVLGCHVRQSGAEPGAGAN